jgi:hypothetical protein
MEAFRSPGAQSLALPARWWSFPANSLNDVDALKTSVATVAAPVTYNVVGDFNGALGARIFNGVGPAFTLSLHNTTDVGVYAFGAANHIVITGWFAGRVVTQRFELATADGNENLILGPGGTPLQPFDKVDSIAIPAQVNTNGAWTFGVRDLVSPSGNGFRYIKALLAGNVTLRYGEDPNTDDALPLLAGELTGANFSRVVGTTTIGFSVGL